MKKFFCAFILFVPIAAFSQPEKGTVLVSGNLSYQKNNSSASFITTTSTNVTAIDVAPYAGYFISPKIVVGVVGLYSKNEQTFDAQNPFSATALTQESTSFGPFARYYYPIGEKFFLFAQADLAFGKGEYRQTISDPTFSSSAQITSMSVALRPAVSYFITKRWAVEVILGSISYANREYKSGNAQPKDMDGFAFSFITRGLSTGVVFTF